VRVLVLGATGGVGREVAREACARGHRVIAQVRPGRPPPPDGEPWLRDPLGPEGLSDLPQVDAIACCLGQRHVRPDAPWSPMAPPADLMERVATALVEHAPPGTRLVVVSAAGVGESARVVPAVWRLAIPRSPLAPAYRDLERMEAILRAATFDLLLLRPVVLRDGGRGVAEPLDRVGPFATVGRTSVARFLVERLEERGPFRGSRAVVVG
jgi:uncharacterized protein YbjT (DUF2867 family)